MITTLLNTATNYSTKIKPQVARAYCSCISTWSTLVVSNKPWGVQIMSNRKLWVALSMEGFTLNISKPIKNAPTRTSIICHFGGKYTSIINTKVSYTPRFDTQQGATVITTVVSVAQIMYIKISTTGLHVTLFMIEEWRQQYITATFMKIFWRKPNHIAMKIF